MFLAAGLAPGVEETVRSAMQQQPEIISADQVEQVLAVFSILQKIAAALGLLCMAGGWGALQQTGWGRWTALAASVLNLPLLPFFTPLGIAGLFAFARAAEASSEEASAAAAPAERPEPVSHVLVIIASLVLVVYISYALRKFAAAHGLPVDEDRRLGLEWILAGQLVFTLFHELGHLLAAWAVGFRFHEINVGPFTVSERPGGSWAFGFDWQRILQASGYLAAVPTTTKDLRMNWILVVIAGPAASLFLAMTGFLAMVSVIGTPSAGLWEWAAYVATIGAADCVANLLPLGLTDGALLVHTALGTRRGKGILAGLEAAMLNDRADREAGLMDPAELLATRKQALERLETNSEASTLAVAVQRIEYAHASLQNGNAEAAGDALQEAGKALAGLSGVPNQVWFRYWFATYEAATARKQFGAAGEAKTKALEFGNALEGEKLDWEASVPIRIACARLWMADGDYATAAMAIQETRERCPSRRKVTGYAAELLAVEAECELRLGSREKAGELAHAAVEIARDIPPAQRATAFELLAHTAVRWSANGECGFAQSLFAAAVEGLEESASPAVAAGYRTAWAEALYENGNLAESKAVLDRVESSALGFALDIEALRAQLLLAEDRPEDAVAVLTPWVTADASEDDRNRELSRARGRALRSWALFRTGITEEAVADARLACDVLMPDEHPDAAPALLTLAMSVSAENMELSEAYVQESGRLIRETTLFSPLTKASRLTDLARHVVQVSRKDWARQFLDQAAQFRRGSSTAPQATVTSAS